MQIRFSDHFTCKKLLCLTFPSMIMLVFTSIYGVVDGFFVSNFVGKNAFTAVNFIMPFLMILGRGGLYVRHGRRGADRQDPGRRGQRKGRAAVLPGGVCLGGGWAWCWRQRAFCCFARCWCCWGAEGQLLENCVLYGRIILLANPIYILQYEFQCFCSPRRASLPSDCMSRWRRGLTNMVLDALFVAVLAPGASRVPRRPRPSASAWAGSSRWFILRCQTAACSAWAARRVEPRALGKVCANGSSELMSNISIPAGEHALQSAAAGHGRGGRCGRLRCADVCQPYLPGGVPGLFVGTAPVISYHYGARNTTEVKGNFARAAWG